MIKTWREDKRWSDAFLHEIKGILGVHLISEPPVEEDQERNTDLVVLRLNAVRIAVRMRKYSQAKYADEFTIRSGRPSGVKTELEKVIEGWGDYFFYGFADEQERRVHRWILGDLKAFRIWHARELARLPPGRIPGVEKLNHDGSSSFRAYKWSPIKNFVIASNHEARRRDDFLPGFVGACEPAGLAMA